MAHGAHWEAMLGEVNGLFERVSQMVRDALIIGGNGEPVSSPSEEIEDGGYIAYAHGNTPARCVLVIQVIPEGKSLDCCTAYPFLKEGVPHVLEVLDIHQSEDEFEGGIECVNRHAMTISFFDPLYCLNRQTYVTGQKYEFSIAGLAYMLEKIVDTNIRITEGAALELERQRVLEKDPTADVSQIKHVDISMAQLRCLLPRDNGFDAEFQTVVEEVNFFRLDGTEVCQMRVVLIRPADEDFAAMLYASEHVLKGYRPQVGDSVRGVLWLQGYPLKSAEAGASWADQVSTDSPERGWESVRLAMQAEEILVGLHIGLRALGISIAQIGWEITPYTNPNEVADSPALLVQRGERQINLWVRSFIVGQEAEAGFTPDEVARFTEECKQHGQSAAFVTVACKDIGDGYTFKCFGLESLEALIGKIGMTEYIRKPDVEPPAS